MIQIGGVRFEWDEAKNLQNQRKHRVSFEEAATVFLSVPLRLYYDPDHSEHDDRFIAVGFSIRDRILVVVHCEAGGGIVVRLISARRATRKEREDFMRELG